MRSRLATCTSGTRRRAIPGSTAVRPSIWLSPSPKATARPTERLSGPGQRFPVGAQRHAGLAGSFEPDAEYLVQLDLIPLETEPRACHVQPPDPRRGRPDLGDRLAPVRVQVGAPAGQGHRVVLAQILLMPDLETRVVHPRDQVAGTFEFTVREDVAVDESFLNDPRPGVVRPGDAVVQQPAARHQLAVQELEVARQLRLADVLGQADRADRVEATLSDLPVVQMPHLGPVLQSGFLDRPLCPEC